MCSPASAEECPQNAPVLRHLAEKYGEYLSIVGLSDRGYIVQVLIDPDDGSFTILAVDEKGCTKFLDSGQAWTDMSVPKGDEL